MIEFLERIAILIKLQNCWTKGHCDITLQCASDGDSHEEMRHMSLEEFASSFNLSQSFDELEATGSTYDSEGETEPVLDQLSTTSCSNRNEPNISADVYEQVLSNNMDDSLSVTRRRQRGHRPGSGRLVEKRKWASQGRRRKPKDPATQHVCPECGRVFHQRQLLITHLVTHTGDRPFPCRFSGCDKRFGQSSTRNYHERIHSDARPYVCSQCGLGFKLAPVLRLHVARMHNSGGPTYSCEQCGRQFKIMGGLRTHIRTVHSDDRPHACDACPKRFKSRQQLVRHTRDMHSTEKPLHCPVCDRAFTQACNMRTHMRTHTGEKPYSCTICGVQFAHSGSLKGHRLAHHKLSEEPACQTTKTEPNSINVCELTSNTSVSTV